MARDLKAGERVLVVADEPENPQDVLKGQWGRVAEDERDGRVVVMLPAPVDGKVVWAVDVRRLVRMPSDEELRAAWVRDEMER